MYFFLLYIMVEKLKKVFYMLSEYNVYKDFVWNLNMYVFVFYLLYVL